MDIGQKSTDARSSREPLFDILRGVAVVLMIASHAIFFFHTDTNEVLRTIARVGNATVFTMLLFVSGAVTYRAYFTSSNWNLTMRRVLGRSLVIYAGYMVVAVIAIVTNLKLITPAEQLEHILLAMIFYNVPSFSEFLIPFLVYPLTFLIFPGFYTKIMRSARDWFAIALVSYIAGTGLFLLSVPDFLVPYKALLVGAEGYLRFPLFQYFSIFSLGLFWGSTVKQAASRELIVSLYKKIFTTGAIVIGFGVIGMTYSVPLIDPMTRWPPSVGFLVLGMFAVYVTALVILLIPKIRPLGFIWRGLAYIGADSFDLYVTQMIFLFAYQRFIGNQYSDPFIVGILGVDLLVGSVVFSSLNWKISPSVFTIGPVTVTNAGKYRIKKRYILATAILLSIIFIQVTVPNPPVIGSFLQKEDIILRKRDNVSVTLSRKWFVRRSGSSLVPLTITLSQKEETKDTTYYFSIPKLALAGELIATSSGVFKQTIPIGDTVEGVYTLTIDSNDSVPGFPLFETNIYITQPVYVSWTLDWEGWDVADQALLDIEKISNTFDHLPVTHFFNPRIFLPNVVPEGRAMYLSEWLKKRVEHNHDEVALHLHMHYDMLEAAGITPKTEPGWKYRSEEGYDVYTTAYAEEELKKLYSWALSMLEDNGLPRPVGYRAGGWFADTTVLRAEEASGFLYDSSGRERPLDGSFRNIPWNLNARSQPYYPSVADQNIGGSDHLQILEIPNNGLDTYGYRPEVLLQRFYANYKEGILREPRTVTFVSHPQWYGVEFPKITKVLKEINAYSALNDLGPVLYVTQQELYTLWKDSTTY